VVFAHRAAKKVENHMGEIRSLERIEVDPWRTGGAEILDESILIKHNWDQVRQLMWDYVGIVRRQKRLDLIRTRLGWMVKEIKEHFYDYLLTPDLVELRNLAVIADLIVQSASLRKESRGLHYILDYPDKNDRDYRRDTVLQK
jgi:L-aspartate oxidase